MRMRSLSQVLLCALSVVVLFGCASAPRVDSSSAGWDRPGGLKFVAGGPLLSGGDPWQAVNVGTGPNTGDGDPLRTAFTKFNTDIGLVQAMFGNASNFATTGSPLYSDLLSLWTGTMDSAHCPAGNGTMVACGGGGGVSSFSGDGSLLNNSASTGAVTGSLANTGVGYGVWGNIGSSTGAPGYHALSSYPTAAFPTLNQSTTGTAGGLTSYPTLCSGGQFSQGLSSGSNNCGTPSGGGSGPTIQTNGANNSSQSALNIENGPGVTCANPSAGNVQCGLTQGSRKVTTTTDTILSADASGVVAYDSTSAVAASIPAATASGFGAGFAFFTTNYGTASVTFTPASAIDGHSTIVEAPGYGCGFWEDSTPTWHIDYSACPALQIGTQTIAGGTAVLGTSPIASGACATVVTVSASGVATTDVVKPGFNGDVSAVTGYGGGTGGTLEIYPYPSANNVNFHVCNWTLASITPGAATLNWKVER